MRLVKLIMQQHVRSLLIAVTCLLAVAVIKALLDMVVEPTQTRTLLLLGTVALVAWYAGWPAGHGRRRTKNSGCDKWR
jgi:hypothetical protein